MSSKNPYSKRNYTMPKALTTTKDVLTKPNQSMSIREILFRNTQGMTYDNYKTPFYEDQATFSSIPMNKIQEMDITDKMSFLDDLSKKTKSLKSKINAYQKEIEKQNTQEVVSAPAGTTETISTENS